MRNIYLCSILLFLGLSQAGAQSQAMSNVITINHFNADGKIILTQVLEDEQARAFDLKKHLINHADVDRISVQGTTNTASEVEYTRFSGHPSDLPVNFDICEQETTSLRPLFGLSAHSTEAFDGVMVDKVVAYSPASQLGLREGDIIYTFNQVPIHTFCDLGRQVSQCSVGQAVEVTIAKGGEPAINETVTIGGQVVLNTKYTICNPSQAPSIKTLDSTTALDIHMQVYPNPTTDIAHIKYTSNIDEPVNVYILDQTGKVLSSEQFAIFTGSMHTQFNFNQVSPGTYLVLIEQGNQVTQERVMMIK